MSTKTELIERRGAAFEELTALRAKYPGETEWKKEDDARWNELMSEIDTLDKDIELAERSTPNVITSRKSTPDTGRYYPRDPSESRALHKGETVESYLVGCMRARGEDFDRLEGVTLGTFVRAKLRGPKTEAEKRAIDIAGEGDSVPTLVSARFIDNLRANLVAEQLGVETVIIGNDTTYARITGDAAGGWTAEAGAVPTNDLTLDGLTFNPKKLINHQVMSRELGEDSVNIDGIVQTSLSEGFAAQIDLAVLDGSGASNQPTGILNTTGRNTLDVTSTGPIADNLLDARNACLVDNVTPTGYVLPPAQHTVLAKQKESTAGGWLGTSPIMDDMLGTQTSAMPANTGLVGDFSFCWLGLRTNMQIRVLRETYAANDQIAVEGRIRADVMVTKPVAFCEIQNMPTAVT